MDKTERILGLYQRFMEGQLINKSEEADRFGVDRRSIQRDIDDIRNYFESNSENDGFINRVIYDRGAGGYRLEQTYQEKLTNGEILAITKILLDSRAFTKNEMTRLLEKLMDCCVPRANRKLVKELVRNEAFHYIEPRHKTIFMDKLWELGQAIYASQIIEIEYQKMQGDVVARRLKPAAIMFSEYYFYLAAFVDDQKLVHQFEVANDAYPTIYRIDRIKKLERTPEHFYIPYKNRFEEGEFRKRIQFMYGGKLQKVKFKYTGLSVEAVLDRLPTAKIVEEGEGYYIIQAEVFGKGIDMWLLSQGHCVKAVSPDDFVEEMNKEIELMNGHGKEIQA